MIAHPTHSKGTSSWLSNLVYALAGTFPTWAGLVMGLYGLTFYGIPVRVFGQWRMRSPKH